MPLEGLKSQAAFEEMRRNYIRELTKAIHMKDKGLVASSQRFYHLTKLMDALHDVSSFTDLCTTTLIIVLTDCYCNEHQAKHELSLP